MIYIVQEDASYECSDIRGMFSTRELAEIFAEKCRTDKDNTYHDLTSLLEVELDSEKEPVEIWCKPRVRKDRKGKWQYEVL